MNLVRILLIEHAILTSGCLAFLSPRALKFDTDSTAEFFETQIRQCRGNELVLSNIRTILESLLTYHLPAETALQSIDNTMKGGIEQRYNGLIKLSHDALVPIEEDHSYFMDQKDLVTNLFNALLRWTNPYQINSLVNYVHQKFFIVMLHVLEIVDSEESSVKQHSKLWAAISMSKLGIDRVYVCGGIMLSVFLKRPFTDMDNEWEMADIKLRLDFQTIWDGLPLDDATKTALTTYMEDTVVPDSVPPSDPPESPLANTVVSGRWPQPTPPVSHLYHVYTNFVIYITEFLTFAENNGMESNRCKQLLEWTARLWPRLCAPDLTPEQEGFVSLVSGEIAENIHWFSRRPPGPSSSS